MRGFCSTWAVPAADAARAQFEREAASRGVAVLAAERFAVGRTPPARAVRVAFCAPESDTELERGLAVLSALLRG